MRNVGMHGQGQDYKHISWQSCVLVISNQSPEILDFAWDIKIEQILAYFFRWDTLWMKNISL